MILYLTLLIGLCIGFLAGVHYERRGRHVTFNEPSIKVTLSQTESPVQFIESITPKEKFDKATNVSDLIS